MDAPPNIDPVTKYSDSDVVHWLTNDTRDERFIDNIFSELCVRLQRAGIPLKRAYRVRDSLAPRWHRHKFRLRDCRCIQIAP